MDKESKDILHVSLNRYDKSTWQKSLLSSSPKCSFESLQNSIFLKTFRAKTIKERNCRTLSLPIDIGDEKVRQFQNKKVF